MNTEIAVNIKGFLAEPWKKVENIFFFQRAWLGGKRICTPQPQKKEEKNRKKATVKSAKLVVLQ